jgi:hypothetical protein
VKATSNSATSAALTHVGVDLRRVHDVGKQGGVEADASVGADAEGDELRFGGDADRADTVASCGDDSRDKAAVVRRPREEVGRQSRIAADVWDERPAEYEIEIWGDVAVIDVDAGVEDGNACAGTARTGRPRFGCIDRVESPLHVEIGVVVTAHGGFPTSPVSSVPSGMTERSQAIDEASAAKPASLLYAVGVGRRWASSARERTPSFS